MISLVEKEIIRQWPALTGNQTIPPSLNIIQASGTNWEGGRVRFVVLDQNGEPILFIRMMRKPENDCLLEEEYHLVESLIAFPALAAYLPELCFLGEVNGQRFVVERAVVGESLFRKMPGRTCHFRNRFKSHVNLSMNCLIELACATKNRVSEAQLLGTVLQPLKEYYVKAGGKILDLEPLIEKLLKNSKGCVETVVTHGDFSPKNLIMRPDGYCTVIDWETARMKGLPLIDLFYFLSRYAYLSGSSRREMKAQRIKAFYESSRSGAKIALQAVKQYCLQMKYNEGIIKPLFLLHFLYKAWLKCRMSGMDDKSTKFWLNLFQYYLSSEDTPWGL
jgi:hypothetical protein